MSERDLLNAQRAKGLLNRTGSDTTAHAAPIGWCLIWRAATYRKYLLL